MQRDDAQIHMQFFYIPVKRTFNGREQLMYDIWAIMPKNPDSFDACDEGWNGEAPREFLLTVKRQIDAVRLIRRLNERESSDCCMHVYTREFHSRSVEEFRQYGSFPSEIKMLGLKEVSADGKIIELAFVNSEDEAAIEVARKALQRICALINRPSTDGKHYTVRVVKSANHQFLAQVGSERDVPSYALLSPTHELVQSFSETNAYDAAHLLMRHLNQPFTDGVYETGPVWDMNWKVGLYIKRDGKVSALPPVLKSNVDYFLGILNAHTEQPATDAVE